MQTVLIVLGAIVTTVAILGLAAGAAWLYFEERKARNRMIQALTAVAERCQEIALAPAYIQGLNRVASDMVIQITNLNGAVTKFHASLFGAEENKQIGSWKPYEDSEADQAFEVDEMVKAGFERKEAQERVKAMSMARDVEQREREAKSTFRLGL